jgi:hypothetical protein
MKINIQIEMGDVRSLIQQLVKNDSVKRGLLAGAVYLKGKLGEYPQQPAGVAYVRTGNLRNRWTHKIENGGLTARIGNSAHYADDVQGKQTNPYFKRVWGGHSIRAVTNRERARVGDIVANEIRRVL